MSCADLSDPDLKIILLGDSAVGKSKYYTIRFYESRRLVERFLMDEYKPRQLSTYALTVFRHEARVGDQGIAVDFWDTVWK